MRCRVIASRLLSGRSFIGGLVVAGCFVFTPALPAVAQTPMTSRCGTISVSPTVAKVGGTISAQASRGSGWSSNCGDSWSWNAPIGPGSILTLQGGCGTGDGSCIVTANLAANGGTRPETVSFCIEGSGGLEWGSCQQIEILPLKLTGTVTEATASGGLKPAAHIGISVDGTSGGYNRLTTTDAQGRYSVTLPAREDYVVRAVQGFVPLNAAARTFDHLADSQIVSVTGDVANIDFSTKPGRCGPRTSAAALAAGVCGTLSVVSVARGTSSVTAAVRLRFDNPDAGSSGCDPKATYAFSDAALETTKRTGPCIYDLTFREPGTGIYHVALRATEQHGNVIPVSLDQFGEAVDGRFTVVIDSCSHPVENVPDVAALLDPENGTCDVSVGDWDADASDLAAKVVTDVESSRGLVLAPVPVSAVDPGDWPGRGLSVGPATGWVPTGTSLPAQIVKSGSVTVGGGAIALIDKVVLQGIPDSWDGAGVAPRRRDLRKTPRRL